MYFKRLAFISITLVALALPPMAWQASAAIITKADNTNSLGSAESWLGGVSPTSSDVANWSGIYSASPNSIAGLTNSLRAVNSGTALSWYGIRVGGLLGTALTTNTIYWGTGGFGAETNLSAATQAGNIVTFSTKTNHGYAPGQSVAIAGVKPAEYNGTFTVLGVPSATSFTCSNSFSGLSAATAFGTVESAIYIGGAGAAIANSSWTIGAAGIDLSDASHSAAVVATSFAFAGNQTWSVAAGGNLRFGGSGVGAANAKVVTSGVDGLIDISGSGTVDANQGGGTGFSDAGGWTGFAGKWRVNTGATLRGLRNGATAWGSNTDPDAITLNGGVLAFGGISGAVGNWTWNTPITLAAGTTSFIDEQNVAGSNRSEKLNGAISGSGNLVFREPLLGGTTFTSADLGFILTGANTMSGTVTIGGPVENGVAGRLTYVRVGGLGGTSTATGIGPDGSLGTAIITNNGVLTFSLTGPITVNSIHGTGSLRVGYSASAGAESQVVTLTGANTYSGNTTINMGSLVVPSGASIPNTANIILSPLTAASLVTVTLDVSGMADGLTLNSGQRLVGGPNNAAGNNSAGVSGNVTAGTGSAIVPGGTNTVNALSIAGNLKLTGGAVLVMDVNNGTSDLLAVQDLSASGVTTLLITPPSGGLFAGDYPLITASGTLGGSPANFSLAGLSSAGRGQTFTLIYDSGSVKLRVTGSPATLTWRGDGVTNVWDTATTTNWLSAGLPDAFYSGDYVTFDDTGLNTPAIALVGSVQPNSITVSATKNYTFAGPGKLSGNGLLTNAGPGTLSIVTANDFVGKTILVGGTLSITNESALGANPPAFAADQLTMDGGTLSIGTAISLRNLNRGITLSAANGTVVNNLAVTISNTITGPGTLTKAGTGTLTMSGSNTYIGGTIVSDGQVTYGHGAGLGRGASTSGTSGYFAKPFSLLKGTVDLNGKFTYDPNFAGGSAAVGIPVLLYDGPIVFGGTAGATMTFQDTATNSLGWGNGNASLNTLTYDATANPGTATISNRFACSGSSGATSRTLDIGDSTATTTEVNIAAPMGVISVNSTNQDGRNTTLVKAGEGTLQVSAANNFPMWQVNAGTLRLNHVQALGADRTISIGVSGGTGSQNLVSVQGGVVDLNGFSPAIGGVNDGSSTAGTIRNNGATASTLTVGISGTNSVNASYGGVVENGTGGLALVKAGPGTQTLGGINTYTGGTVVSNGTLLVDGSIVNGATVRAGGTLGGVGTINGVVTVDAGGTLAPGAGIGTLTLAASPVLNGAVRMEVDRNSGTPLADKLIVTANPIAYLGTLVLTNIGAPLEVGDTFTLFSASGYSGAFTLVSQTPNQTVSWNTANLAINGSISVASVGPAVPPSLTCAPRAGGFELSWPADYTGWQLQVQTNLLSVGINTNWAAWPDSTTTNQAIVPITPENPSVFLRLIYPPQP